MATTGGLAMHQPALASEIAIDNIRFVSMVAIVALHCQVFASDVRSGFAIVQLSQALKFATINFFIISGFLLGDNIFKYHREDLFRRRCARLLIPWLMWSTLFGVVILMAGKLSLTSQSWSLQSTLAMVLIGSPYWFIPNFLISFAIVLFFRNWLDNLILNVFFAAVAVFYGMNLYFKWLPATHTSAVFGFTIYFILGVRLRRAGPALVHWIERRSALGLVGLVAAAYVLSLGEAEYLSGRTTDTRTPCEYPIRFQRPGFPAAVKTKRPLHPEAMQVRRHTFGIYLIHPFLFTIGNSIVSRALSHLYNVRRDLLVASPHSYIHHEWVFLVVWLSSFTFVYGFAWLAAALIASSRAAAAVGMAPLQGQTA